MRSFSMLVVTTVARGARIALAALSLHCSPTASPKVEADGGALVPGPQENGCDSFEFTHASPTTWVHLASCSDPECGNGLNPPTGGKHCATPLACRNFSTAQPRCQWIHNLEHGHWVLAYNCPEGCPEIVSALENIRGQDARTLIVPDPALPKKVAAIVAGWSYVSDTVDDAPIACIRQLRDTEAPEANLPCAP